MIKCYLFQNISSYIHHSIAFLFQTSHHYSYTLCNNPLSNTSPTMLIAEICLGIHIISLKCSLITPAYDLFVSFIRALALTFFSDSFCLSPSGLLLFELLGKTYPWTQGTLSTTSCRFKTNYTCTKGPKTIRTLCCQPSTLSI